MLVLYILIFLASCAALFWAGRHLVDVLVKIAKFLSWREFVVAFFIMSFATSLPNLFVDVSAALRQVPQLAFGDIIGGNMFDITIAIALAILLSRRGLPAESRMVQTSAVFTSIAAILPLLLAYDGNLNRADGIILLIAFALYTFWLFSKEERFKKIYKQSYARKSNHSNNGVAGFVKNFLKSVAAIILLLLASQGIVMSAQYFSIALAVPIALIGILVVGVGNCFPETYFSILSSRKGEGWMILGNIMGSVIVCATLVLGIVVLISPIQNIDFSAFAASRIFMILAAIFFLLFVRTGRKISKKEAIFLMLLYVIFVLVQLRSI